MRAPEELNEVNWATLEHAYGPADDVPEMIRALYAEAAPETEDGENVGEELVNNLNHQGSFYPATLEAVPFLAHLALHVVWHRGALLEVLTSLAELDEWGVPAPESLSGRVREAVLAELPLLMGCLTDPDPFVRQTAIRMACVAEAPYAAALVTVVAADRTAAPNSHQHPPADPSPRTRPAPRGDERRTREARHPRVPPLPPRMAGSGTSSQAIQGLGVPAKPTRTAKSASCRPSRASTWWRRAGPSWCVATKARSASPRSSSTQAKDRPAACATR